MSSQGFGDDVDMKGDVGEPVPKRPRKKGEPGYKSDTVSMDLHELEATMELQKEPPQDRERIMKLREMKQQRRIAEEKKIEKAKEERKRLGTTEVDVDD